MSDPRCGARKVDDGRCLIAPTPNWLINKRALASDLRRGPLNLGAQLMVNPATDALVWCEELKKRLQGVS